MKMTQKLTMRLRYLRLFTCICFVSSIPDCAPPLQAECGSTPVELRTRMLGRAPISFPARHEADQNC
jgi:hypothetical protein